jgi:hypothetical protein
MYTLCIPCGSFGRYGQRTFLPARHATASVFPPLPQAIFAAAPIYRDGPPIGSP